MIQLDPVQLVKFDRITAQKDVVGVLSDFNSLMTSEMFLCIQIYTYPSGAASGKVQSNVALLQQST